MDITYRTLGPWGSGKGANLQPSEVDSNFYALAQAIVALETNPAQPVGIASITVSGTQMYISLTDGTVLGPYTIPVLTFRWRGEWEPGADYVALDVVTVAFTGIFMCQVAHTSGDNFDLALEIDGALVWLQLFGSVDASLAGLSDVQITDVQYGDFLMWGSANWQNIPLGSIAFQNFDDVSITGGSITGLPAPSAPSDAVTKAYVDALPAGMTVADDTMMANISGLTGPALPHSLSDFLDYALATTARGTMLYRGAAGWQALAPGTSGYFLQTGGSGLDPSWQVGGSGVTSITAGAGIDTTPDTITASGTVALAPIADKNLLANITGSTAAPLPASLSAYLDYALTNVRGSLLSRTAGGWVALAPGATGYYLQSQGSGADLTWNSPAGAGTVTSINAGTGISTGGAPITGSGSVSLASVATGTVLANISGSSAAPTPQTLSLIIDTLLGATQGAVLYRGASTWTSLTPGTNGQVLTTHGSAANPTWSTPAAGGSIANNTISSNISGSTAAPIGNTLSNILDAILGSTRGTLLYRGASGWAGLTPGSSGTVLTSGGTTGDPSWTTPAASSSSVATVGDTFPASPVQGQLHWLSTDGQLYIRYGTAWVISVTPPSVLPAGTTANDNLIYDGSLWAAQRPRYGVAFSFVGGVLGASQLLGIHCFTKAVTFNANWAGWLGHTPEAGGTASATASTVITVERALSASPNSWSSVGSITIAAGSINPTFSSSGAVNFSVGDRMRLVGPSTPDSTFQNFYCSLVGKEA